MSLLEQNITKKEQVDKKVDQMKFDVGDNDSGEYKIEATGNSAVYAKKSKLSHLSGLYYLIP